MSAMTRSHLPWLIHMYHHTLTRDHSYAHACLPAYSSCACLLRVCDIFENHDPLIWAMTDSYVTVHMRTHVCYFTRRVFVSCVCVIYLSAMSH